MHLRPLRDRLTPHQQQRRLEKIARRRAAGHVFVPPTKTPLSPERKELFRASFRELRRRVLSGRLRPAVLGALGLR